MKYLAAYDTELERDTNEYKLNLPNITVVRNTEKVTMNPKGPYDSEIEYLQSSGTQWIDTNIIPNSNTGIMIYIKRLNSADTYICGLRNNTNNTRWCIGNPLYYGYGSYSGGINPSLDNKLYVFLNYKNDKKFKIPNYANDVNLPTLPFTPTNVIRLFGSSGISASYTKWTGIMYGAKITQDSKIISDFIPVRVGSVGYMYDKISKQLFGNIGTGSFTLGPDKS